MQRLIKQTQPKYLLMTLDEIEPICFKTTFLGLLLKFIGREKLKELTKQFDKSENDLKALQSVGQIVGEVLKQLTEDKCK